MLIQDLPYIENVDRANEINGSGPFDEELFLWGQIGGNFGRGSGESDVIGNNTFSRSIAKGAALQDVGSSSSADAIAWAIPGR